MKTLIELFDEVPLENIVAGLRFRPEKIIFIGFKEVMTKGRMRATEEFFNGRPEQIAVDFQIVDRYNYGEIEDKLRLILQENQDCCFDLTGGKELVLAAMGAVSAERKIPMFQINVRTGNFIKVQNCEEISETEKSALTLSESVALNGCAITHIEEQDYDWYLSEDFIADIEAMWEICRENCGLWNRQSLVLESFERFGTCKDELTIKVSLRHMENVRQDTMLNLRIIGALLHWGLITDYEETEDGMLTFRYKNEQVRRCLTKAGNILELYAYMLMKEIAAEEPGYYDDLDSGVYIDWDGVIHGPDDPHPDTKNEVDIMAMRDLVPIFISCKNGEVRKEALYELSVVANRFGGRYAKKFMLATYMDSDEERCRYLSQRAVDMGIVIIDGVHRMTRQAFKKKLKDKIR